MLKKTHGIGVVVSCDTAIQCWSFVSHSQSVVTFIYPVTGIQKAGNFMYILKLYML